jgi:hypothetical protein
MADNMTICSYVAQRMIGMRNCKKSNQRNGQY